MTRPRSRPGQFEDTTIELTIERPVAGGRTLARHDGQIVFVSGTMPGERVRAQVERRQKQILWARTVDILDVSPDRREPPCDPACGGSLYAHIAYARQLELKSAVIADAYARIAHAPLDAPVAVAASQEQGYRMRARLHCDGTRWGFLREGTHTICDAAATGQLLPATIAAIQEAVARQQGELGGTAAIVVSENVDAGERAIWLEPRGYAEAPGAPSGGIVRDTALSVLGSNNGFTHPVEWSRHATSFFQGNRYLLGDLLRTVLTAAAGARIVNLYSGVGLFAVPLAARGARVIAVEGDASSGADLVTNAKPFADRLRVLRGSVEDAIQLRDLESPDVVVLDPPRTGASAVALAGLLAWTAPRIVYVSCDPPTLARDTGRILAAGYRLASLRAFDCFPNTPHVECVAVFDR